MASTHETVWVASTDQKHRLCRRIMATEAPFRCEIKPGRLRSVEQNAYLWGVCYPVFLQEGGLSEMGWRAEDLHDYFVGECFGWERLDGMGRPRMRRLKRTRTFTKAEFSDFVDYVQQQAAERGLFIPDAE